MKRVTLVLTAAAALVLSATTARAGHNAQPASGPAVDARWAPWLGCWIPANQRSPEDPIHICVVPSGTGGVRVLTRAGDRTVFEETIVADGTERAVEEPSCRGRRRAEWSADGQRVFSSATLTCDKEPARTVSGLTVLTTAAEWLDIQVVQAGPQESVRVRRYRRSAAFSPDPALLPPGVEMPAAPSALGTRLTIDHVIEASGKVTPRLLEALLFETKANFPLDGRTLIALDDAGVPDTAIDLMVAFSFPKQFEVQRSSGGGGFSSFGPDWGNFGWGGLGLSAEYAYPWYANPYYSYYSPFGYSSWNYGNGYYYYPGGGVIAGNGDGGAAPTQGERHGRVVNGSGYTQVVTRAPESDGQATQRLRGAGTAADSGFAESGGSSGGSSGVSSGGYSSGGGGGGDSGRSAVPR